MGTAASDTTNHQSEVPNSEVPRSMASAGLGQKLFMTPLPSYSGPYSVGYMEIEVPVRDPRSFPHIRRDYKQLLNLETVLFSLYYPCHSVSRQGPYPEYHRKLSRPTWLPHPRFEVGRSYARVAGLQKWPTVAVFAGTTMSTKLPAIRNAGLAEHWPPYQKPEPLPGETEKPMFPLMIFSHGLGGIDTLSPRLKDCS